MTFENENPQKSDLVVSGGNGKPYFVHPGKAQRSLRLDFRYGSSHLTQKKPGYYLLLLRNEIRHRSLREKPTLANQGR
jgi:hypothetical protein